jgi:O-antigen biosynthesis protein
MFQILHIRNYYLLGGAMARVAWLIPRIVKGSGGIRTMFQHAKGLEAAGHQTHLYIEGVGDPFETRGRIQRFFGYDFDDVHHDWKSVKQADVVIATIWYSAAIAQNLPIEARRIYFVQDYEPWFNPMGDAYLLAEGSYNLGLTPVTIGRWLAHELSQRFGTPALHYDFGADPVVYHRLDSVTQELAVCFLYQPEKPRRCSRIGIDALGIVKHYMPEVKIYLYGSNEQGRVWFDHESLGLLGIQACNALYNRCAVGLSLSPSNPSRVPFEMMASGLPVVEMWRANTIRDFPSSAISLANPSAPAIAEAILELLNDEPQRVRMSQAGLSYMANRSTADEIRQFVKLVEQLIANESCVTDERRVLYDKPPVNPGKYVHTLPESIQERLAEPPNAALNRIHPWLREILSTGACTVRRLIDNR